MTLEAQQRAAYYRDEPAIKEELALKRMRELVGEINPARAEAMDAASGGRTPTSTKHLREVITYLAEGINAALEPHVPKKRGRPPTAQKPKAQPNGRAR